jgi:hypothetical protein
MAQTAPFLHLLDQWQQHPFIAECCDSAHFAGPARLNVWTRMNQIGREPTKISDIVTTFLGTSFATFSGISQ